MNQKVFAKPQQETVSEYKGTLRACTKSPCLGLNCLHCNMS